VKRPSRRHLSKSGGRSGRLVAVVGGAGAVFFLAIAVTFMAVPLLNTSRPLTEPTYLVGDWRVEADIDVEPSGEFDLVLRFFDPSGEASAPADLALEIAMLGHEMAATEISLRPIGAGTFRGQGTLPMMGKWRFLVEVEQNQLAIVVDHAEEF
jgi:hypothetical protein